MTRVYGGCVEPGGMELDDDVVVVPCPKCQKPAKERSWESCEGGSLNLYSSLRCDQCGYFQGDDPFDLY